MDLRIDHPLYLLLVVPIAIYLGWQYMKERQRWQFEKWLVFSLRVIALLLLLFAFSTPYLLLPVKDEQIVFLVDRSASMRGTEKEIASWIDASLQKRQSNHLVGVYSFADQFQTDMSLAKDKKMLPEFSSRLKVDQSNIAQALQLSSNIADSNKPTRIILFSDGLETKGSVSEQLGRMKGSKVQIDIVKVEKPISDDVAITSFESPPVAYEGEQQQLVVKMESSTNTSGELSLYQNDERVQKVPVQLDKGTNTYSFQHKAQGEGLLKYDVQLTVANDGLIENNKLTSVTTVQSSPKLLIVHSPEKKSPIASFIDQQAVQYDEIVATDLPTSQTGYLGYDAIIFDNVPGHLIGEEKMGMIEQAVKNFGLGFMMVGGENSYGLGGYFKTPIEKLLPVEMEVKGKHQLPSLGLVVVLDRSGSMGGMKIELAKEAAARSVELLREEDTLGFIAFDDRPWEIIETGPMKNKEKALEKILSVTPGGGTEIYRPLELAYLNLKDQTLQRKHIILLTDGQSATNNDYNTLLDDGKDANITLSTVAIGEDADRNLLKMLGETGGGRFYDVADATTIPSILSRETAMITRTYIEDHPFYPIIHGDRTWQELFASGVPQMNAYIATTAKQTASVVAESEKNDPVLAEWSYGLGKAIAFTSDSTGKWSGDWARWEQWSNFWNTAVSKMLPKYNEVQYDIKRAVDGSYTVFDPSGTSAFLDVAVVNNRGEEIPITTEPIAPGKTKVTMDTDPGLVFFRVSNDHQGLYQAGLTIPYSEEYKLSKPNEALLDQMIKTTNGKILNDPAEAFRDFEMKGYDKQNIEQWVVLSALILFFIDITIRRFGLRTLISLFKRRSTQVIVEKKETNVETLLKGKKKR